MIQQLLWHFAPESAFSEAAPGQVFLAEPQHVETLVAHGGGPPHSGRKQTTWTFESDCSIMIKDAHLIRRPGVHTWQGQDTTKLDKPG